MHPEPPSVRAIFCEAVEIADAAARAAYLATACGGDASLQLEVEELLRADETAGGFLITPADARGAQAGSAETVGAWIGRYQLLQKIGEGGCGVVYRAEQIEPARRRVALKVIKLGMDTRAVIARFEAERQALELLDHPHIARVLDAGATETGRPFFVMELVEGIKVTSFCEQNQLPTAARLRLFIQICQAVQHAHQKGIIHRDLKPSNILVTSHEGVPLPKVIDFGIAKATTGVELTDKTLVTSFDQFIGTPAYLSPEQAGLDAAEGDTRTDIYSLGVLLYELLTGRPPFDSATWLKSGLEELRKGIRETEPTRPSTRLTMEHETTGATRGAEESTSARRRLQELIHELRGDLDGIILKVLEKDRNRRYQTANALAADLQRPLDHEPVVARPPSALYLLQKTVRRNRPAFGAAAVLGLLLVAGIVFSVREAARTRARKRCSAICGKRPDRRRPPPPPISGSSATCSSGSGTMPNISSSRARSPRPWPGSRGPRGSARRTSQCRPGCWRSSRSTTSRFRRAGR